MPDEQISTAPSTTQTAPAPSTAASATTEDSTLLGGQQNNASEGGEKTLLGEGASESETKTEEQAKPGVPEKYEFQAPEGFSIDEKAVEAFSPVFKDVGLSQEQAQKLVNAYAPFMKQQMAAQEQDSINYFKGTIVKEWRDETVKELGSDYNKQVSLASRAIDKANIPGLRQMMDDYGVGNHVSLVKFFAWAGQFVSPDNFPDSGVKHAGPTSFEDTAKIIYS